MLCSDKVQVSLILYIVQRLTIFFYTSATVLVATLTLSSSLLRFLRSTLQIHILKALSSPSTYFLNPRSSLDCVVVVVLVNTLEETITLLDLNSSQILLTFRTSTSKKFSKRLRLATNFLAEFLYSYYFCRFCQLRLKTIIVQRSLLRFILQNTVKVVRLIETSISSSCEYLLF